MKLRFEVDQAECFRRGIDTPKSIVTIDVDPKQISQEERNLIADRLLGIDVCKLRNVGLGTIKATRKAEHEEMSWEDEVPIRIVALSPDYKGLIEAIRKNQNQVEGKLSIYLTMKAMPENTADGLIENNNH